MGAVMDLTIDAMRSKEEATLKSILAALWHLSANSDDSKAEICAVDGALAFLIDMLDYEAPSKSAVVAENASGVLKNVSSHVATRDDYKQILREKHCVSILLRHLKSQSTVLVNNVCGTLCNLSKQCPKDQQILWESIVDSQSIPILQSLTQSKHKMISTNASILLRNLLGGKCQSNLNVGLAVSITGFIQTQNATQNIGINKDINVNVRTCADKENARVIKRTFNKEMTYCANQNYMSINARVVDNYKILNNRADLKYIQTLPEKIEHRKIKYCPKTSVRDENYDLRKMKDMIRTSVPLNSPSEPDNFARARPCSSPVDESTPLNELLDNNSDTSNCMMNEISPTYVKSNLRYPNYIQNGTSSHHTSPIYSIPADKSNSSSFDEDINDQPVDYSKKYVERNATNIESVRVERTSKKEYPHRGKVNLFGDYAETDIDQPTNYSLRYAEDDTDEDEKATNVQYFVPSEQEDTVQTYCTEGTPYQTPLAFSAATSMSDLREDSKDKDNQGTKMAKRAKEPKQKALNMKLQNCEDKKKDLSALSLGIMSPEKPVNYCEEGTPGYFSRVSSLSSLNSALAGMNVNNDSPAIEKSAPMESLSVAKLATKEDKFGLTSRDAMSCKSVAEKDVKSVSFIDTQCTETPLMFSRCSSLSSLSGFEQHSIPEDRSSTYDLSRRTSGLISPSEIPDSPTQTVPPSPKHHKSPTEFRKDEKLLRNGGSTKPLVAMRSIFEDEMATYKEESTPIEFSAATSLSSLTIDDDLPRGLDELKDKVEDTEDLGVKEESHSEDKEKADKLEEASDKEAVSDDEDDEDILAACINMGMRNNRYRQSSKKSQLKATVVAAAAGVVPAVPNFVRYAGCSALNLIEPSLKSSKAKSSIDAAVSPDTVHIYCTEDTPADISPVGSHSNLSALSLASIPDYNEDPIVEDKILEETERKSELSDESSNLSGDEEKLLDKCIQSGMPKERPKCVAESNKCEDKFSVTPSTSPVEAVAEASTASAQYSASAQYTTPAEIEIFDDSSNHSEDEAILAECIKSAMPKERSTSAMQRVAPSAPKMAPQRANLCSCPTVSPLRPNYLHRSRSRLESADRLSLSEEEEDMMLAQCIKSGMPKTTKTNKKSWKKS